MSINVTRSSMPDFSEYCDEIKDVWDSRWLTNRGAKHALLQKQLEEKLDCPHVVLYANGHLALENSIEAMGFPRGSEIITTPFTFVSTTHAIARNGLVPVFCDIEKNHYTMDASKIEALITEKTVAILPVHIYGNICDVEAMEAVAKKHNLKVLYDAAHGFAEKYKGVSIANFGDASIFSFNATKVFHTIEGGAVCLHDDGLANTLNELKNFGRNDGEIATTIGGNAKMNEFQAAMGICNLRHLEDEIEKRKQVFLHYHSRLQGVKGIRLPAIQNGLEPNYQYYPVVFDGFRKSRDEVFQVLSEAGIFAKKYFYPLTSQLKCYQNHPTAADTATPVAKHISERILTLPLYADLSLEDVDRICRNILK